MAKANAKRPTASAGDRLHHRVQGRARQHYFRIMPNNPRHRAAIWSLFWLVSGIIVLQLIYPPTRAVPTAMLDGQAEAWQHENQLAARISALFARTAVSLKLGDTEVEVPLAELGAAPETAQMVGRLTKYPFWQRYVPLSVFLQPARLDAATVTYTSSVALERCRELAAELSYAPTNARLELSAGELIASDERPGRRVDADKLCRLIQTTEVKLGESTTIGVAAERVPPDRTAADFAAVRRQAERALQREITLQYRYKIYQPSASIVASWLKLQEGTGGQTALAIDQTSMKSYLDTINSALGRPAGTTNVRIVDGREVGREVGSTGKQIDYAAAARTLESRLLTDSTDEAVTIKLVDVPPTITYNNRYTATETGLKAYADDAAHDYNAHIMLQQLDGEGWTVGARQHESIPSASTYKLYVAMWLFDQMEQGKLTWQSPILDTDVSTCFDRMTIASTNECSQEWLAQSGRQNFNQYLYGRGVSRGTTFTSPIAVHTTAADLTEHMVKLARGQLYPNAYRQRLYQSLSTHPYRYGIAAGSTGQVYDKVGFLWDYVHDTAVVNHPRGSYALTIMTKGQSYARIASITREIERIMYP